MGKACVHPTGFQVDSRLGCSVNTSAESSIATDTFTELEPTRKHQQHNPVLSRRKSRAHNRREGLGPVWDYRGKDIDNTDSGDFAGFLAFIGPVASPPTKLLRFGPADGLESSGVLEFLDIDFENPGVATDKALTDLQQSARTILCSTIASQRRDLPAGASLKPNQIHLKPVLDAYIKLLSACKEVECIEMPLAWASLFRPEDAFPKINMDSEEELELLQDQMAARWGRDPGGEERSLMLE
ncbi:hypothetical protein P171DRAFT_498888 [Karstenula rhodostoma CBS 690.94]|uniref:Uncharacterized protein n=1 Tax=Karstenula rhodostoma CBS 690.94 TaxID=1392251 RepID=A0A9P4PDI7_9PLEO|nr:hypothetical protein P171DRAFT_498888 [Karstenula rhodostoma CBS 690.94]